MKVDLQARRRWAGRIAAAVCLALAALAATPILGVLWELWSRGHGSITWEFLSTPFRQDFDFETGDITYPGGIWHAIVGTGIVVLIGSAMGAPAGILTGIYLSEIGRGRIANAIRLVVDAMAGLPSVVAGLFAVALVATFLTHRPPFSAWTAGLALGLLMLPTVARTTEEALRAVPHSQREASLALGAPQWRTVWRIVLPGAWPGMATGLLLGVARIAGETAPLLLTLKATTFLVKDPGAPTMATLPGFVNYYQGQEAALQSQAWGAALVLVMGILAVNLLVRLLGRRRTSIEKR